MDKTVRRRAYGKINLTLDILGVMENGYHSVEMIMQQVSVYDSVSVGLHSGEGTVIHTNCPWLPCDERNLAWKAVEVFKQATGFDKPVSIDMVKYIPVSAGMAGGSSDAAAVLWALNKLSNAKLSEDELCDLGSKIGSDIPFCIKGGTMLATSTGAELSRLPPMPDCHILLAKPRVNVSTPAAYARFDRAERVDHPDTGKCIKALEDGDLQLLAENMRNVFEDVTQIEDVKRLQRIMTDHGAIAARMSGSGPTVFGIFTDEESMYKTKSACRPIAPFTFCCKPINK